jgi:hypothetical protein
VFFSKCIGGGNIYPFWGSMVMLIVNFILIAITIAADAIAEGAGGKNDASYSEA